MITWQPDPVAFHLGPLSLRWYTLFFTLGYVLGYGLFKKLLFGQKISARHVDVLLLLAVLLSIAGARIFHVLFYDWAYFSKHPGEILQVSAGGLASHGGGLGLVAAAWLWCRWLRRDLKPGLVVDLLTLPCALADGLIRIGNFFNSELVGTPSHLPWAIVFARVDAYPRHPVQLYEAVAYLALFLLLWGLHQRQIPRLGPGRLRLTGLFLLGIFVPRFLLEYLKEPPGLTPFLGPFTTGQALSLPFILAGAFFSFRALR